MASLPPAATIAGGAQAPASDAVPVLSNHDAKTETAEPLAAVNETAAAAADKEELLEWCREAVLHRYRFLHWLGSGAFGEVVRVFDAKHSLRMAVKLIKYDHEKFDAASLYHRVIIARETLIGRAFSMSMWPTKKRSEEKAVVYGMRANLPGVYGLVMAEMDTDAATWLCRSSPSNEVKKRELYSLLQQVSVLHQLGCVHRDMKPTNILVRDDTLHLADFGAAAPQAQVLEDHSEGGAGYFTGAVGTFWYQAPETFAHSKYTTASELWSVGVIAFNMFADEHICLPSTKTIPQLLQQLVQHLGVPPDSLLKDICSKSSLHDQDAEELCAALSQPPEQDRENLPERLVRLHVDATAAEFILQLLVWDPTQRLTMEQALGHEFFKEIRGKASPTPTVPSRTKAALHEALADAVACIASDTHADGKLALAAILHSAQVRLNRELTVSVNACTVSKNQVVAADDAA